MIKDDISRDSVLDLPSSLMGVALYVDKVSVDPGDPTRDVLEAWA